MKNKLEVLIKHETPKRSRQVKSEYRNKSRDNSNISSHKGDVTKSPHPRADIENNKTNIENDITNEYYLKKSDTVKRLSPCSTEIIVQPKIRGKDHNEIITTELLKKSSLEMKRQSFSSLKELERLAKINKNNLNNTNSEFNQSASRIIESIDQFESSRIISNESDKFDSKQIEQLKMINSTETQIPSIKSSPVKLKYSQQRK